MVDRNATKAGFRIRIVDVDDHTELDQTLAGGAAHNGAETVAASDPKLRCARCWCCIHCAHKADSPCPTVVGAGEHLWYPNGAPTHELKRHGDVRLDRGEHLVVAANGAELAVEDLGAGLTLREYGVRLLSGTWPVDRALITICNRGLCPYGGHVGPGQHRKTVKVYTD